METRILTPQERESWDEYVLSCPHSIAWQLWEWSEVLASQYNLPFYPLIACEGQAIKGVLPLYPSSGRRGTVRLLSVPFAVAGGIAADSAEAEAALLAAARELATQLGAISITLKQYKRRIQEELNIDDSFLNRELALTPVIEDVWRSVSEGNRRRVDEARSLSLELVYPDNDQDGFYALLLAHEWSRGIPCPGPSWIRALVKTGMYKIAMMRSLGRPVAATLVKQFKDTISFPYTCLRNTDPLALPAVYRLYWEIMARHATAGTRIFHSGRMPLNEDVPEYRKGWGGTQYRYYYEYWPATEQKTESVTKRGGKRALLQAAWRRLPLPIARIAGPLVFKRFP